MTIREKLEAIRAAEERNAVRVREFTENNSGKEGHEMKHRYTVTYYLSDEQEARLVALTARYNRLLGGMITPEGMLESLLVTGSAYVIDERMNGICAALDAAEEKGEGQR